MAGQDLVFPIVSPLSRRRALSGAGLVLSGTAVALLGSRDALAAAAKATPAQLEADARILNSALGAELEKILTERGILAPSGRKKSASFEQTSNAWRSVLSGETDDLSSCGTTTLDRFGAEAPRYAGLDLPASALLDTLLLPFSLATALGLQLGVSGGL